MKTATIDDFLEVAVDVETESGFSQYGQVVAPLLVTLFPQLAQYIGSA
jgi:hypothetical protein